MLTVLYDFQAWEQDKNMNIQKQNVLNLFFSLVSLCSNHLELP